jgi:ubiquinone/menaquinone biosynthesis C-methylase UbiE
MKKANLLNISKSLKRDLSLRQGITYKEKLTSSEFGKEYFDGDRRLGYGGYTYDGRWIKVAKDVVKLFNLKPTDKVLDIGCGKGFLVNDLISFCQIDAYGVDISEYALQHSMKAVAGRLHLQDMRKLIFPDHTFDAILCINTLHNLPKVEAYIAIQEMNRVVKLKKNIFIQVDSYRTNEDLKIFEDWVLTAKLYMTPSEWLDFFKDCNYQGSYFWTILNRDGSVE